MIDKNDGGDYSVNDLRKWKTDFEALVKDCLEGKIKLYFQNKSEKEFEVCKKIFKFLEQRGALYMDLNYEVPWYVFDSAKEIRTFLTHKFKVK